MLTPILNLSSLILGLTAWGFGLWAIRKRHISLLSFCFCLLSLVLQFMELSHRAQIGDSSGILDTVRAVTHAAATLSAGTLLLNTLAHLSGRK